MNFEITLDDIKQAVEVNTGIEISEETADRIMTAIDHNYIERAALRGGTFMADQVEAMLDAVYEEVVNNFDLSDLED